MTDICVIGSLNVDVSYRMHRLPVAGETVLATDRARAFGGKGGNQAVAVAALGAEVSFVGAVGADAAGRSYLEHLRTAGIEASGVREIPGVDTGAAMILVDDLGENLIIVDPGRQRPGHADVDDTDARRRRAGGACGSSRPR